jgi:hypothetical protein
MVAAAAAIIGSAFALILIPPQPPTIGTGKPEPSARLALAEGQRR